MGILHRVLQQLKGRRLLTPQNAPAQPGPVTVHSDASVAAAGEMVTWGRGHRDEHAKGGVGGGCGVSLKCCGHLAGGGGLAVQHNVDAVGPSDRHVEGQRVVAVAVVDERTLGRNPR